MVLEQIYSARWGILGAIGFVFYEIKRSHISLQQEKKQSSLEQQSFMRLQSYVQQTLQQGYSKEQIRQTLLKEGWSEDIVNRVLKINNRYIKEAKSFFLILCFAIAVLIATVGIVRISSNITGWIIYKPIQIFGTVEPELPNGTIITFRLNGIEVARTELKNSSYGYDEKIYLLFDDETTLKREGYREGDTVKVYIEDIEVAELSYFEPGPNKKDINIPASIRNDVATKAAKAVIERGCSPDWQCWQWGECIDGVQERECIDTNECGTEKARPAEKRECEKAPAVERPVYGIIEMITAELVLSIILFIILIVSLIILINKVVWDYRIKKYAKKKQ